MSEYALVDSGDKLKLESLGGPLVIRPSATAYWSPLLKAPWKKADFEFQRLEGNKWILKKALPENWTLEVEGISFKVKLTDFGHIGLFPEHAAIWNWVRGHLKPGLKVLNLFAYSGGATLALAQAGAQVCHVDASHPMVQWAKANAALNKLDKAPIRWIVDDVFKFLKKEINRKSLYDGIILDPPSFGRGSKSEIFKLEEDILMLLKLCKEVLKKEASFFAFSTHTPGLTPLGLQNLLSSLFENRGKVFSGELSIPSKSSYPLPAGNFAIWSGDG